MCSKLSFVITQHLFNIKRSKLVPRIEELNHGLTHYVSHKDPATLAYSHRSTIILLQNIKSFNTPIVAQNFIEFVEKWHFMINFKLKMFLLNLVTSYLEKNLIDKKQVLKLFNNREIKFRFNLLQIEKNKTRIGYGLLSKKLIVNLKRKKFEQFFKFVTQEHFSRRDTVKLHILEYILKEKKILLSFYSEKILLEFFKFIFSTINRYSAKNFKEFKLIKKTFKLLNQLLLKFKGECKPFLSEVSGLLKWSLNNTNSIVRKYAAKVMVKLIPFFYFFKEKILIGHFGIILVNNLNEKNQNVLKYFIQSLRQIITIFPRSYCIPPIRVIFSNIVPIMKNKDKTIVSELICLVYAIIDKKYVFIPKKDVILLCYNLLKIQKNLDLKNRKFSMQLIGKISRIYGTSELVTVLASSLEKSSGIFRISLIVTLTTIAYEQRLHLILPMLYNRYFEFNSNTSSYVFKTLIYILEYVNNRELLNYLNSLGTMIERAVFDEKDAINPLLFLLIGKFSQKFEFLGFEKRLIFLFKFILVNSLTCNKNMVRYMFFAFEKLLISLNPLVWWNFVFQGLTHRRKKIRALYWKFQKMIKLNRNLSFFFLKYLMGSKRNLSRTSNFFF